MIIWRSNPPFILQLIFAPLEGRVRLGVRVRMDGPMSEKIASSNLTTPDGLINDVIKSEMEVNKQAHLTVCPIITSDERTENVDELIKTNNMLVNIFKEKLASLENLRKFSFDELLMRLSKQNNMEIVNSVADFLGLGIPKICQVKNVYHF